MKNNNEWQLVYSDIYPDNTIMRIELQPLNSTIRLTIVDAHGASLFFLFGSRQAFQAAFALLKALDMQAHIITDNLAATSGGNSPFEASV